MAYWSDIFDLPIPPHVFVCTFTVFSVKAPGEPVDAVSIPCARGPVLSVKNGEKSAPVTPLCAWGRCTKSVHQDKTEMIVFLACVALARSRKFAPFPVRMFFRGDSRRLAANRGELPQLAATRGLNPIQYNTAHQLHQNSTIFFPCACVAPRWIILQSIAGAEKRTPLLSSERAQKRFLLCGSIFPPFVPSLCACAAC